MPEATTQRIVPGAPPPTPLSKSQKKKRKVKKPTESGSDSPVAIPDAASAALVEQAPEPTDIREGSVAPELVAEPESQAPPLPEEEVLLKPSPIVDLIHKRLKATTKKIVCHFIEGALRFVAKKKKLCELNKLFFSFSVTDIRLRFYRSRKIE